LSGNPVVVENVIDEEDPGGEDDGILWEIMDDPLAYE